jgi:hypothetical protein
LEYSRVKRMKRNLRNKKNQQLNQLNIIRNPFKLRNKKGKKKISKIKSGNLIELDHLTYMESIRDKGRH